MAGKKVYCIIIAAALAILAGGTLLPVEQMYRTEIVTLDIPSTAIQK